MTSYVNYLFVSNQTFSVQLARYSSFFVNFVHLNLYQTVFFPRLVILDANRLEYNKSTYYKLNCSSARQSVETGAEFLVNRQTVEHISFHDNICYNSKRKECTTDNCLCFPNSNAYIYYYEESTAELIIGCQMRFTDNETSNIIKVLTSVRINGSGKCLVFLKNQFYNTLYISCVENTKRYIQRHMLYKTYKDL